MLSPMKSVSRRGGKDLCFFDRCWWKGEMADGSPLSWTTASTFPGRLDGKWRRRAARERRPGSRRDPTTPVSIGLSLRACAELKASSQRRNRPGNAKCKMAPGPLCPTGRWASRNASAVIPRLRDHLVTLSPCFGGVGAGGVVRRRTAAAMPVASLAMTLTTLNSPTKGERV
jgi:hypothetical protein